MALKIAAKIVCGEHMGQYHLGYIFMFMES